MAQPPTTKPHQAAQEAPDAAELLDLAQQATLATRRAARAQREAVAANARLRDAMRRFAVSVGAQVTVKEEGPA